MAWTSLGSVVVSRNWQSYPLEIVGSETIRLLQTYNTPPWGQLTIAQFFPHPGGRASFRRVFPDVEPTILQMPIPIDLKTQGQDVRVIQIRHALREFSEVQWTVEVQALY